MKKDSSANAKRYDFPDIFIVVIKPFVNVNSEDFSELAEVLRAGFEGLGAYAKIVENQLSPTAVNVIVGGHLLDESKEQALTPNVFSTI